MASECQVPAAMAVTPVSPATRTGSVRVVSVPSPSAPDSLLPQAQTVPSFSSASEW